MNADNHTGDAMRIWRVSPLRVFVLLSIGLHLIIVSTFYIPVYMDYLARKQKAALAAQKEARRKLAEQRKKEQEQARREEHLNAVKERVADLLRNDFNSLFSEYYDKDFIDELWDETLDDLDTEMTEYADEFMDEPIDEAALRDRLDALKKAVVQSMYDRLKAITARKMAERFLANLEKAVAPKMAEAYEKDIRRQVGSALNREGGKIVRDETSFVKRVRAEIDRNLSDAARNAKTAADRLAQSARRQDKVKKDVDSRLARARSQAKNSKNNAALKAAEADAAKRLENAVKTERAAAREVKKALDETDKKLQAAVQRAVLFGEKPAMTLAGIQQAELKDAYAQTADIRDAATFSQSVESVGDAKKSSEALQRAIQSARQTMKDADFDPAALARAVMKDAVDETVSDDIQKAFAEKFSKNALPRLSDKIGAVFDKKLEKAGLHDEAVSADVRARIAEILGEKIPAITPAADAGVKELITRQKLRAPTPGMKRNAAREKAVADTFRKRAADITESGMEAVTGSDRNDARFVNLAARNDGDDPNADADMDLFSNVSRLSNNVSAGRMGFLGGVSSVELAGIRRTALRGRSRRGRRYRDRKRYSRSERDKLTEGIADRGDATGESWITSSPTDDSESSPGPERDVAQPGRVIVPSLSRTERADRITIQQKAPFQPSFKTINYAAIPFRNITITLDGDPSEWKDVPALVLHPDRRGGSIPKTQTVKVVWDTTAFYFCYEYTDVDSKITKVKPANFWEGDAAEIWFDTKNTKNRNRGERWTQQFWVWPFGEKGDDSITGGEALKTNPRQSWRWVHYRSDTIQRAAKRTRDGWTMEVIIPVKAIRDAELEPGQIIGFNLSLCSGTNAYYYWAGSSKVDTSEHPDTWGDVLLAGSDGKVDIIGKPSDKSQRADTDDTTPDAVIIGKELRIRVTDPDMNLSPDRPDRVSLTVSSRGDQEIVTLKETGNTSGVFEGGIPTAYAIGEIIPDTLTLYDGEPLTILYIDEARANGARNVEVTLTVRAADSVHLLAKE